MALMARRLPGHTLPDGRELLNRADNDQLLLNCALARSASTGLDYFILPRAGFYFGRGLVTFMCPKKVDPGSEAKIPPVVWHSAGFSTDYKFETQVLLDLNWTDLDASGGHCAAGQRGSWEAFADPPTARRQLCDHVRAKGIQARMLYKGSGRAIVAEEWLASFEAGWKNGCQICLTPSGRSGSTLADYDSDFHSGLPLWPWVVVVVLLSMFVAIRWLSPRARRWHQFVRAPKQSSQRQ